MSTAGSSGSGEAGTGESGAGESTTGESTSNRRLIVGLTGGIGSGKSTVAARLRERGAVVIDVDALGRAVAEIGGRAHTALVGRFGSGIVRDGALDRAALARQVFGHPGALTELNAISHPAINAELARAVAASPPGSVVVFDQAVLVESPMLGRWGPGPEEGYGPVVVVTAPPEVRIERLVRQRGMAPDDARARMASQVSDAERRAVATWVVDNGGDVTRLEAEVERVWADLTALAGRRLDTGPSEL